MSPDALFATGFAVTAVVTYGCRLVGFAIGTCIGDPPVVRKVLDILPACAIGAVLGPMVATVSAFQAFALLVSACVLLRTGRFLLALGAGTGILLVEMPLGGVLF